MAGLQAQHESVTHLHMTTGSLTASEFSAAILDWYDGNARQLPWRTSPADKAVGVCPDPYHVWLSEIMLQQTTIPHATRYFLDFTKRWPSVEALASASRDEVMNAWAGLGYYSRARNLHACAQIVAEMGGFPETSKELIKLPGIGPYTSGAIAAIAFDKAAPAVDGNVERVTTRYLAMARPLKEIKSEIKSIVTDWVPDERPGDFAQAMMDLGATICTPKSPNCLLCPVMTSCEGRKQGIAASLPNKGEKKAKPTRKGQVYISVQNGVLLAERRMDKGLLAGTLGLPTSDWLEVPADSIDHQVHSAPEDAKHLGQVEHVFTHFRLLLDVYEARKEIAESAIVSGQPEYVPELESGTAGFPSVFRKALNCYLSPA